MPNDVAQYCLLLATGLLFGAAFLLGLQHMRRVRRAALAGQGGAAAGAGLPHEQSMGPAARAAVGVATAVGAGLLIWRGVSRQSFALPVSNPFDAFLLLGLLVAATVIYFRWTRHLRGFSFFLLPMIVILLALGFVLALVHPSGQGQDYRNVWTLVHVITINVATVCFTLACVGGAVYLLADRQLRGKGAGSGAQRRWFGWPPLASIEKIIQWMAGCGFPLLTISTIAGILRIIEASPVGAPARAQDASQTLKMGLGILCWVVYGVLLHVPWNPRFRGRRAAWLSIVGFVLFIAAFAAARWS